MRSRYRILDPHAAHFITASVVQWLPIFGSAACCEIVVRSLEFCRARKGLRIYGWVILDTHFHAVVSAPELSDVLRDLKSEGRDWLLKALAFHRAAHKPTAHQVSQEGSHSEAIAGDAMMEQKLEYLHNNPVKRGLVASPEHWRFSSAHEWLPGTHAVLRCDAWR